MATSPQHWRDLAIAKSEIISDAWEVTKAYAARLAEWVLFLCMVANIVEILPGVSIPGAVSSAVLGIQAVTLDIAGFGLASMSEHAKRCGNLAAARKGSITGYCLIGLMLLTLLVVSIGHLWPVTLPVVAIIEKILLLVRVLMTVIYGHVIHGLRASHATQNTAGNPPINTTQNTTTNTPNSATTGGQKSANAPAKNPPTNTTQNTTTNTTHNPPINTGPSSLLMKQLATLKRK